MFVMMSLNCVTVHLMCKYLDSLSEINNANISDADLTVASFSEVQMYDECDQGMLNNTSQLILRASDAADLGTSVWGGRSV